jgi:DNA-directed RNA polymerase II subunit RPB1
MERNKNLYIEIKPVESVTRLDFSPYGALDILRDSCFIEPNGATIPETFNNDTPVTGGVADIRAGSYSQGIQCGTCGQNLNKCPGHMGHIKLSEPVYHRGFLESVEGILNCCCIKCRNLLPKISEDTKEELINTLSKKQRLSYVKKLSKNVQICYVCGNPAYKIKQDTKTGAITLISEPKKKQDEKEPGKRKRPPQHIPAQLAYDMLSEISQSNCNFLGLNYRPENLITTIHPLASIQIRPSIRTDAVATQRKEDGITVVCLNIVKSNENLKDAKGDGSLKSTNTDESYYLLQIHCDAFFSNDDTGASKLLQKNKQPIKSITERIKGKDGRIRGNLMGKRVNMSARSVITSELCALNEIRIPLAIAKKITYPEIVTDRNINFLQKIVNNGPARYPGANFIKKRVYINGEYVEKEYSLAAYLKTPKQIIIGDVVERHLIDGDAILFNRQPSLHKMSMMGHICKIIPDPRILTFGLNVNVTEPYNADFDGDEMNLHAPQSPQTLCEILAICNVAKRFVHPGTSKISFQIKQDTVMGCYVQTLDTTYIDWKDCMNISMITSKGLSEFPANKQISGRDLLSLIIPPNINITKYKDNGDYVMNVINGKLLAGTLSKPDAMFILQKTWFQNGSTDSLHFIDDLHMMMLRFLMIYGFTTSIGDTYINDEIMNEVNKIKETVRKSTETNITEYENDPYKITQFAFEENQKTSLQAKQNDVNKLMMTNLSKNGGLYKAILSGSSGADLNASQIAAFIGQTIVEGKRIQNKFNNRTLPCFFQYENSASARGFIFNSFVKGMDPVELFFHCAGSREGIINTSINTANTGYVQRRLIKLLEDIKQEYDGTVRNAVGKIIQIVYGDNGVNVEKQIEQKIGIMSLNNESIRKKYIYNDEELSKYGNIKNETNNKLYEKLIKMRDKMRKIQTKLSTNSMAFKESFMMPVDLTQYITNIKNLTERNGKNLVDPHYVLENIKEMYNSNESRIIIYNPIKNNSIKKRDDKQVKFLLKMYLYDVLCPKRCTNEYLLSKTEFDSIKHYFYATIMRSKIEGGEMVGVISGQSIGEPVSQINMKSFHSAGTGRGVAGGFPRITELLSVSPNIKNPIIKIMVKDKYKENKNVVSKIASNLKYTTLRDVVESAQIIYDPEPFSENSIMVNDGVDDVFEGSKGKNSCQKDIKLLPWTIRLALSKEKMYSRNVSMLEIKTSICINWANKQDDNIEGSKSDYKKIMDKISAIGIVSNYNNSDVPIIHVRFNSHNYNNNTLTGFLDILISKYKIKGIPGIVESDYIDEETYYDTDADGNMITKKQFVIYADGNNLSDITSVRGIKMESIYTNDIVAVYEMYGIEAARALFIKELTTAIESAGAYCNVQHIELLADAITHPGELIAVSRHGANKLDTDPLSRASFEETVLHLVDAAVFTSYDHIRSVSSKIMMGDLIIGGTGAFDVLLDSHKLKTLLSDTENKMQTIIKKTTKSALVSDLIRKKNKK